MFLVEQHAKESGLDENLFTGKGGLVSAAVLAQSGKKRAVEETRRTEVAAGWYCRGSHLPRSS